ncbi:MAG: Uncharacterised protein [Cyanobium sp. ARS6]|nr:MAG: Uncharacterised protein [Cyanobium sp. ARS6]
MHDSLTATAQSIEGDAMPGAIALEGAEHLLSQRIRKRTCLTDGGNDVINRGDGSFRTANRQTLVVQSSKGLRTGDFVNQMQTDEQLCGTSGEIRDAMQIPDLVVKGSAAHAMSAVNNQP